MDQDTKVPWEGAEVKHIDGAAGRILGPVEHMPGYFMVRFNDGIKSKQRAESLLINGEPLDKLMRDLDQEFNAIATWKELCLAPIEFLRKRLETWKLARYERTRSEIVEMVSNGQYEKAESLHKTLSEDYLSLLALSWLAPHIARIRAAKSTAVFLDSGLP